MVHLKLRNLKLTIFILPESDVSHVFTLLVTSTDWDWDSWDHDQWEQSRVNTGHCSRTHQRQHCPWYSSSPILRCHTALLARARYSANTLLKQMYLTCLLQQDTGELCLYILWCSPDALSSRKMLSGLWSWSVCDSIIKKILVTLGTLELLSWLTVSCCTFTFLILNTTDHSWF